MENLKLGDEVVVVTIGNNARYKTSVYKAKVVKIGRKWFHVHDEELHWRIIEQKFSIETGISDGKGYSPEWQVYRTEQDYLNEIDKPILRRRINSIVDSLNYEQLKQIEQFINTIK